MRRQLFCCLSLAVILPIFQGNLRAQEKPVAKEPVAEVAAPSSGVRAEFLDTLGYNLQRGGILLGEVPGDPAALGYAHAHSIRGVVPVPQFHRHGSGARKRGRSRF